MNHEADRILQVFKERDLRAGSMIHQADFGEAIEWEGGFVRDESVRDALAMLFEEGYLIESNTTFELTAKGEEYLYADDS